MTRRPDAPLPERDIKRLVMLELGSRPDILLWNQNVGLFYAKPGGGQIAAFLAKVRSVAKPAELSRLIYATLLGRPVKIGAPGMPDIMGIWQRDVTVAYTINPAGFNPVDKRVPVTYGRGFAIETKTEDGRLRPDQEQWRDAWVLRGGIYVVARGPEDVRAAFDPKQRT